MGAVLAVAALVGIGVPALESDSADQSPAQTSSADTFGADQDEAIGQVLAAIEAGGPLPYAEDGQTFQNREGLLPQKPLGYYREYTVETPGSPDRGARRLVIGDGGETYYTDDHYASFTRIEPEDFSR